MAKTRKNTTIEEPVTIQSPRRLSAEKNVAILEAAIDEFIAHGYASTSMDRVAAGAGVSKATVYSHFGNKEQLFEALIRHLTGNIRRTAFETPEAIALRDDPRAFLRHLAMNIPNDPKVAARLIPFARTIIGESGRFPQLAQLYVKVIIKPVLENIGAYLASRPELGFKDPEASARLFIGSVVYHTLLNEIFQAGAILPMDRERMVENLLDVFLAGSEKAGKL